MSFRDKAKHAIQFSYNQLLKIDDSPHKIALGFGLGVAMGILPGAGPAAAVVLAVAFRVNRAAALAGSLLTNTWLSVVTFILSVKIGSLLSGTSWRQVMERWRLLTKDFHWEDLADISFLKFVWPVFLGYLCMSLLLGCLTYLGVIVLLSIRQKHACKRGQK